MKKTFKKVVSFVMMLTMIVTALVIPNVEAKAAENTVTIWLLLSAPTSSDIGLDMYEYKGASDARNFESEAEKLDLGWGRDIYKFTKVTNTTYKITITGKSEGSAWNDVQFLFDNGGRGYKFKINDSTEDIRALYNENSDLYYQIDMSQTGWVDAPTPTTVKPNFADPSDAIAKINAIGTVGLNDESKKKIDDAKSAVNLYTGDESDITNLATLTAAESTWNSLVTAGAGALKIHVKAENWDEVAAYAWGEAGEAFGSWTGTKLTVNPYNDGWNDGTFTIEKAIHLIVNNNIQKDGQQSELKWTVAGEYWITVDAENKATASTTAPAGWLTSAPENNTEDKENTESTQKPADTQKPSDTQKPADTQKPSDTTTTPSKPKYEKKYSSAVVVGDFSALKNCNIEGVWDVANVKNNMTYLGNGVYQFVLTFDKTADEITIEYKIAFDNKWDHSIGLKSVNTDFQDGGANNNVKLVIPAGSTTATLIASEKDWVVYDSFSAPEKINEYVKISKMGDTTAYALYVMMLMAGCGLVAVAAMQKKKAR